MSSSSSFKIGLPRMNCLFTLRITEYVIFGTAAKRNQSNSDSASGVYLGDQVLNCRPFYNYLGVYLGQTLSFTEHVTRLDSSRQLGLLSRLRNSLTVHAAERIFTAMILPFCVFSLLISINRFVFPSCRPKV